MRKLLPDNLVGNTYFGHSIAVDGDTCVVGAITDTDAGNYAGAVYVFIKVDGEWYQQQKLIGSDTIASDRFGNAVAVFGDTLIATTVEKSSSTGAAYVFTRRAGVWTQQQKLVASDAAANAYFGSDVSIFEYSIVIGSAYAAVSGRVTGAAYVFTVSGGVWTEQQKLSIVSGDLGMEFGTTVRIEQDTIAVGAPEEDLLSSGGAVFIFTRSVGVWTYRTYIGSAVSNNKLGSSIDMSGNTLAIAGQNDWSSYIYTGSGDSWSLEQTITVGGVQLGFKCAIDGDTLLMVSDDYSVACIYTRVAATWSQEGYIYDVNIGVDHNISYLAVALDGTTAYIGMPEGAYPIGCVLISQRSDSIWQTAWKLNTTTNDYAYLGFSVSLYGDISLTGAPGTTVDVNPEYLRLEDLSAPSSAQNHYSVVIPGGIATLIIATSGPNGDADLYVKFGAPPTTSVFDYRSWDEGSNESIPISTPAAGTWYIMIVAYEAYTGLTLTAVDGETCLTAGAAYFFNRVSDTCTLEQKVTASDVGAGNYFGSAVSLYGDTAIIGARLQTYGGGQGSAYIFIDAGSAWTEQQKLTDSAGSNGDYFGYAVAVYGDTVVVGAPGTSGGGAVLVFTRSGGTWSLQQKFSGSNTVAGSFFGGAVALHEDTLTVGSATQGVGNPGSAYVFTRSGSVWTEQHELIPSDLAAGDNFGTSVSVNENYVVVGSPYTHQLLLTDSGSAYLFNHAGVEVQKLLASDPAANDFFGYSVAIDTGNLVVVGAYYKFVSVEEYAQHHGYAYLFKESGGIWSEVRRFSDAINEDDRFGWSVAIQNGNMLIGAYLDGESYE